MKPAFAFEQDQYVEVRKGNIILHLGATDRYRDRIEALSEAGFNQVLIGSDRRTGKGIEVIQREVFEGGFTLAESTALDMLTLADRNPDRYAGLNPLAIKAILLAGARINTVDSSIAETFEQLDVHSGAGLLNRRRSLEIFSSGRKVSGSAASHPMGWDRSVVYSGHTNRYTFEISQTGSWDLGAAFVANPIVDADSVRLVTSKEAIDSTLYLRRIDENGELAEVIASSMGTGLLEYLYIPVLSAGRYVLEVESSLDGLSYGVAWHTQPVGTVLTDGDYDPVFLFRKDERSAPVGFGTQVQFSGTSFGALDSLVKLEFFADGRKIGESERPEFDFSWIADREGSTDVFVVATDRYGNQTFSSVSTVEVHHQETADFEAESNRIPENLAGVYFGSILGAGSEDWIAVSVLPSGEASVLGCLKKAGYSFLDTNGVVEADGTFVFPSISVFGPGLSGDRGVDIGEVLRGTIGSAQLEGEFAGTNLVVSCLKTGRDGNFESTAGYAELGILRKNEGRVALVMDGEGQTRGVFCHSGLMLEIDTRIQSSGAVGIDLGGGNSLLLDLSDQAGRITGTISLANGQVEELMGIRDWGEQRDRLANISTQGAVSSSSGTLIAGFVVEGEASKQVLIRAVGPSLSRFGVVGAVENPKLSVFRTSNGAASTLAINDDWDSSASVFKDLAAKVGAFPLLEGQSDAAIIVTLEPGVYTAQMTDSGSGGIGLIEVYDAESSDDWSSDRIVNISTRGLVRGGIQSLVGGFVVSGSVPKRILIRAIGPTLADFGIQGCLETPRLLLDQLVDGANEPVFENDRWGQNPEPGLIQTVSQRVGAFPLKEGSEDAAVLILLEPGAYTARIEATARESGIALLEIYEVTDE